MTFDYYKEYFTKDSIGRYDMAPLYGDSSLFTSLINDLLEPFKNSDIDKIVAIDATGFIIGAASALHINKGVVLVRKAGKIPLLNERKLIKEFVDYTGTKKSLEIDKSMIVKGGNYLILDDWVETGSQVNATISMIEELGGNILGISSIGSDRGEITEHLFTKYNLYSIGVNV